MMHLVLEQVQEQAVHPLLLDVGATMHGNDALQSSLVKFFDHAEQTLIYLSLRLLERRNSPAGLVIRPGGRPERAAFHGVHVEAVDDQDMIERGAQAGKEACSFRDELVRRKPGTGGKQ